MRPSDAESCAVTLEFTVGMQRLTGFTISRALKRHGYLIVKDTLHRVFLLHGTELLQLAQNENKVTLVVVQMSCLSETQRLLHTLD